jgi:hypothetical protein
MVMIMMMMLSGIETCTSFRYNYVLNIWCICWLYGVNINQVWLSHSLISQVPAQAMKHVTGVYLGVT